MFCSALQVLTYLFHMLYIYYDMYTLPVSTPPPGLCLCPVYVTIPLLMWALSKYCFSLFPLFSGLPSGPISSDVKCRERQKKREGEREEVTYKLTGPDWEWDRKK